MHTAREKEALLLQIACLEGQVQQITKDWEQLGQWEETDQRLLTAVQEHTEQVQALLDRSGSCDQQIRNALSELLVIGHVQQVLLEQTMQREANERRRMAAEALEIVQAARHEQEPPDHP